MDPLARSDLKTALAIDELVDASTYTFGEFVFEEGLGLVRREAFAPTEGKEWFTTIGKLGYQEGLVVGEQFTGSLGRWGIEQDILFSDAIDELFVHSDVEFISYEQEYSAS